MSTILEEACKGSTTQEMKEVAQKEKVNVDYLREMIAQGKIIM
ncbi:MAG: phosphomethylpyrimidine synthase ThiC, partial [Deltaproteobacteria bacterium]|nr:phosphomethylpyrimidine synthase ThiC [Deltaproteobacteria bacterium]